MISCFVFGQFSPRPLYMACSETRGVRPPRAAPSPERAPRPVAAPPTPSPRPKALQNRPRVARVSPQFPLNDRIPSLRAACLCAQPGVPSAAAVDEKSGKRTTPPRDRARDGCALHPSEAAQVAAHAAAACRTPSPRDDEMRTSRSSTTRRRARRRETTPWASICWARPAVKAPRRWTAPGAVLRWRRRPSSNAIRPTPLRAR